MEVWDTMSLSNLFRFAYSWVVREFDLEISAESVNLWLLPYTVLAREGYLFEVPVVSEDYVEIEFDFFDSQIRRAKSPHVNPRSTFKNGHPSARISTGSPCYDQVEDERATGLESKSYDRIRQTFNCSKFSGKTKDWKLWDKGLHRYLSIWELNELILANSIKLSPQGYLSKDSIDIAVKLSISFASMQTIDDEDEHLQGLR